jgi:hypothetical protein
VGRENGFNNICSSLDGVVGRLMKHLGIWYEWKKTKLAPELRNAVRELASHLSSAGEEDWIKCVGCR